MTLDQIEDKFLNGFHDAELLACGINVESQKLTLDLKLDLSSLDPTPGEPESETIRVTVFGLEYFKLDPPELDGSHGLWKTDINAGAIDSHPTALSPELRSKLSADCFVHWLFLHNWNSLMVVAGRDASYEIYLATDSQRT
jgi:hypothetical protein